MKKLLVAALGILLVAALAGAGTFAYFSDTEASTGNSFTAGTLDLAVGGENPNQSPDFQIGNVKPGDSGTITYTLNNVGTLDGYLDLSGITVTDAAGTTPESEPTPDNGELSQNLYVTVKLGATTLYSGLLKDIGTAYDADIPLAANGSTALTIDYVVDKDGQTPLGNDVGNDIQGDKVTVSFNIDLEQQAD